MSDPNYCAITAKPCTSHYNMSSSECEECRGIFINDYLDAILGTKKIYGIKTENIIDYCTLQQRSCDQHYAMNTNKCTECRTIMFLEKLDKILAKGKK